LTGSPSEVRHVIVPLPIEQLWFLDLRTALADLYDPVHMRRIVYGVLNSIRSADPDLENLQTDVFPDIEYSLHCNAKRLGIPLLTEESWIELQSDVTEVLFNWFCKMRAYYERVYPMLGIREDEHYGIFAGEEDSFFIWISRDRNYRAYYRDRTR